MKHMSRVAIITARGGSKRIPRKNIRDFCGKPIISYSISAAIETGIFDRVMVSTDDKEIADIAIRYGASVPFYRSEANSNDYADTTDVIMEVLRELEMIGEAYEEFCCIYPTAPFVTSDKLIKSHELLGAEDTYNVVPMVAFSFPPQRGMVVRDNQYVFPVDAISINMRSQDLPDILHDVGQFYWCKTDEFRKNQDILCNHTRPFIVSEIEAQDIDNEDDWKIAEIKYKYVKNNKHSE